MFFFQEALKNMKERNASTLKYSITSIPRAKEDLEYFPYGCRLPWKNFVFWVWFFLSSQNSNVHANILYLSKFDQLRFFYCYKINVAV